MQSSKQPTDPISESSLLSDSGSALINFINATVDNRYKYTILLSDPEFINALREKLQLTPSEDDYIDRLTVQSLLSIKRTTCYKRTKAGILILYKTEGSTKLKYSRKQVLSTLKPISILKRNFKG